MKQIDYLIIAGGSITKGPWFTWADNVQQLLMPNTTVNLSEKGCGNKFIALCLINHIVNNPLPRNTLIMPMFTMVDKFDQYVDAKQAQELSKEKHSPITLESKYCKDSESGFWGTGCHFPLVKKIYKENFYNLDWFVTDTIFNIYLLKQVCDQYDLDFFPVYDSDIWSWTESDYNQIAQGQYCAKHDLLSGELARKFKSLLPESPIAYKNSLLEFARQNHMRIYNSLHNLHPPSNVHWAWTQSHVLPCLESKYFIHKTSQSYIEKIEKFSQEWDIA